MKKYIFITLSFFLIFINGFSQNVGVGTIMPDSSAQLDVFSTNKGFLPPRVALTATNVTSPVAFPAPGLLVFNSATSGVLPYNVSPGYYYWNGISWYPVINKGNSFGDMQYWDGTKWIIIPIGNQGDKLTVCNGITVWGGCSDTLTLIPQNNPNEAFITSAVPSSSTSGISQLTIAAWTGGGVPYAWRALVKFDMTSIPNTAIIQSAKLSLFSTPTPEQGNGIDAQYGTSNACYIQRVTNSWATNTTSWNNQPNIDSTHEVTIPQSTSSSQDNINMDVTNLIKDITSVL